MLFAASLPLSKFTISLAQFIIAGNWLLEGNYKYKWSLLKKNRVALIFMSLYLIHIVGLWNTSNYSFALNDLKTKVPILVFPFLMATSSSLGRKEVDKILWILWGATLVSTLISLAIYLGITGKVITDIRQISPLISHIRLALLVCMAVTIAFYFIHSTWRTSYKSISKSTSIVLYLSVVWFVLFLIILESLTGLLILLSGTLAYSIIQIISKNSSIHAKMKSSLVIVVLVILVYSVYRNNMAPFFVKDTIEFNRLPKYTLNGNLYQHSIEEQFTENGHYYGLYQCEKELEQEWNKRSLIQYDSLDAKNQPIHFTLLRYLTSKGLTKDSLGLSKLGPEEIDAIEQGIPNYRLPSMNPIESRAYQVFCEYQSYLEGYNSSGHSLSMRLHYWEAAIMIIQDHFFTGVGTGDLEDAFQSKYVEINSPLELPWRHRAHNQFLTMFVAFGLFGFLFFIFWIVAPLFIVKNSVHPAYMSFLFIFLISMLFEDTLETQAGLSFVVFFSNLFLLERHPSISPKP